MKTPLRQSYAYPARYTVTEEPYQIDWSALLEDGETVASDGVVVTVLRGDTLVDRVNTEDGVTTFWLSGGTAAQQVHQIRATCTTSAGETDAILVTITVPQ